MKNRQLLDDPDRRSAKHLTVELRFWPRITQLGWKSRNTPNLLGRRHRLQRARHDLRGPRPVHVIGRLRLEQFRVSENDPELVVEAMKEETQFGRLVHWSPRQELLDADRPLHQAWFRPSFHAV
jgi:hypothetical protein